MRLKTEYCKQICYPIQYLRTKRLLPNTNGYLFLMINLSAGLNIQTKKMVRSLQIRPDSDRSILELKRYALVNNPTVNYFPRLFLSDGLLIGIPFYSVSPADDGYQLSQAPYRCNLRRLFRSCKGNKAVNRRIIISSRRICPIVNSY